MNTNEPVLIRLRGGGEVPGGRFGRASLSWPFLCLEMSRTGDVSIRVTSRLMRWFGGLDETCWVARWEDIAHVLVSRHNVFIALKHGRGCRFVRPSARRMREVTSVLEERGVEISHVMTTFGKAFTL
jgi:hypothetical protein